MDDFLTLSTPTPVDDGQFTWLAPSGWNQGRGLFGGLVLATLTRAMEFHVKDPQRQLRSLTAELCAPTLPGPCQLRAEVLRTGANVSTVAVRLLQGGQVQAHAVGVLARGRDAALTWEEGARASLPAWQDVAPLPIHDAGGPEFSRHFEYRCVGPLPFSGGGQARSEGWTRPLRPGPARDAAFLVACADAWWPAAFARLEAPRPMATLAFSVQLLASASGLPAEAPLYHRGTAAVAAQGYTVEFRELRSPDGTLLALNQQTIVVIR